EF
ncbi:hypothetical protein VCHENC02_2768B, partial [Vibrio harveyi]